MRDKKKEPRLKKDWPPGSEKMEEQEKDLPLEMHSRPPRTALERVTGKVPDIPPRMSSVPYVGMTPSSLPGSLPSPEVPVPKSDTFRERRCPLNSDSHSEHDKAIFRQEEEIRKLSGKLTDLERQMDDAETVVDLRFHNETEKLRQKIKELEGSQVVIPEGEKDRTSQVLAQRVYELQKQNTFLREKLKAKQEAP